MSISEFGYTPDRAKDWKAVSGPKVPIRPGNLERRPPQISKSPETTARPEGAELSSALVAHLEKAERLIRKNGTHGQMAMDLARRYAVVLASEDDSRTLEDDLAVNAVLERFGKFLGNFGIKGMDAETAVKDLEKRMENAGANVKAARRAAIAEKERITPVIDRSNDGVEGSQVETIALSSEYLSFVSGSGTRSAGSTRATAARPVASPAARVAKDAGVSETVGRVSRASEKQPEAHNPQKPPRPQEVIDGGWVVQARADKEAFDRRVAEEAARRAAEKKKPKPGIIDRILGRRGR